MIKIELFRNEDINNINDNMKTIIERATRKKINTVNPLINEFNEIQNIILENIKNKKRIIYGGTAWNLLVKNINKKDAIYSDIDMPDIDFYSNEPIKDMQELCDILASKGYEFVQGKNAQHDESYKIFVNFHEYCNITYMPSNIFFSIQHTFVDGFKLIHPKVVLIDLLRQYNDPVNSMWRMEKNFKRGNILLKYYPFEVSKKENVKEKLKDNNIDIIKDIFEYLVFNKSKKIIWIDYNVMDVYLNPSKNLTEQKVKFNGYDIEIISQDLYNDTKDIYYKLQELWAKNNKLDKFSEEITIKEYYPFFQFLDRKVEFYHKNTLLLTIYGNNDYCIPFNLIDVENTTKSIMVGTFNVCVLYLIIKNQLLYINKDRETQYIINYTLYKLIDTKNKFLTKNKLTIIDETIFQDFKADCFGITHNPLYSFMKSSLNGRKDKSKIPKSRIQIYDPSEQLSKDNFKADNYYFSNTSGNIINNPNDLIINLNQNIVNSIV
jgi:hypothetical protein